MRLIFCVVLTLFFIAENPVFAEEGRVVVTRDDDGVNFDYYLGRQRLASFMYFLHGHFLWETRMGYLAVYGEQMIIWINRHYEVISVYTGYICPHFCDDLENREVCARGRELWREWRHRMQLRERIRDAQRM